MVGNRNSGHQNPASLRELRTHQAKQQTETPITDAILGTGAKVILGAKGVPGPIAGFVGDMMGKAGKFTVAGQIEKTLTDKKNTPR